MLEFLEHESRSTGVGALLQSHAYSCHLSTLLVLNLTTTNLYWQIFKKGIGINWNWTHGLLKLSHPLQPKHSDNQQRHRGEVHIKCFCAVAKKSHHFRAEALKRNLTFFSGELNWYHTRERIPKMPPGKNRLFLLKRFHRCQISIGRNDKDEKIVL